MNPTERYQAAVTFLEGFHNLPIGAEFNAGWGTTNPAVFIWRMQDFLDRLGNPEKNFKIVHVTGTAGKGSVSLGIKEGLFRAGMKTGLFTSPFVTTTLEKIEVNDRYISPSDFADIVEEIKPAIDAMHDHGPHGRPSYFELCFAAALLYFKKEKCDWVVLEVGLGGRYDATNIVKNPVATVLTNIDYDHTNILGKTLNKIAHDKAGIIKKNSLFFTTEQRPQLQKMFKGICQKVGASYNLVKAGNSYQERNQSLIKAVIESLGFKFNPKALEAKYPARFEVMSRKPLIVIDGAHSPIKMRATVANVKKLTYNKLHLVIAMAANKDSSEVLGEIIALADYCYFTRFQNSSREVTDPKTLMAQAKQQKRKAQSQMFLDPHRALAAAKQAAGKEDLILITGSFFLAGDLRQEWINEETILKNRKSFIA